jgi:hypothetical protein
VHHRTYLVHQNELAFQIDAQFEKLVHQNELDRFGGAPNGLLVSPLNVEGNFKGRNEHI